MLPLYDVCLRLNAEYVKVFNDYKISFDYLQEESSGADGEVAAFEEMGKPVFYDLEDLYFWVDKEWRG